MAEATIKCPKCGEVIEISQAISHDIKNEIKKKYDKEIESVKQDSARKLKLKNDELETKFNKEKKALEIKIKRETEETEHLRVSDLKEQLEKKTERLKVAEQQELELRKQQHELEDKKKSFELEMTRKLDSERQQIAEKVSQDVEESHRLKDAEKEKQFESMKKQIDDLKRKAEQRSQKIQGEVLEMELEDMLSQDSPFDIIEPVSPGVKGGDIIHSVKTQSGKYCGKILWETKRTRIWNDKWIQKVKDDQRDAKADIAVIVSETLPSGFHHFRQIEGVWVTDIPSVRSLALALGVVLKKAANERRIQAGKEGKMEIVYNYLMGPEFKNHVEAIVEGFISMKDDLEKEKASMQRQWAKREKNIERVIANTVGMYGDLEGIAGASLPSIKMLELPSDEQQEAITEKIK